MWTREKTVVLNAANQSEQIELGLPGGDQPWIIEAFMGSPPPNVNVLIFEGQLSNAECANRIASAGAIDAKMVVPPGSTGKVRSESLAYITVFADAVPAGNIIVTVRLLQAQK